MALETEVKIRITQEELALFALALRNWELVASHPEKKRRIFSLISPTGTWKHAVARFASALSEKRSP